MNDLVLRWPDVELSPNGRACRQAKTRIFKAAKEEAYFECRVQKFTAPETDGKLHLFVDFYRKQNRAMDGDNCLASCKAYIDGIALHLGINDSRFIFHPYVKDELGGKVVFRLTTGPLETDHAR